MRSIVILLAMGSVACGQQYQVDRYTKKEEQTESKYDQSEYLMRALASYSYRVTHSGYCTPSRSYMMTPPHRYASNRLWKGSYQCTNCGKRGAGLTEMRTWPKAQMR